MPSNCAGVQKDPELLEDVEDNAAIGLLFTYGHFRLLDLADLESFKNFDLACPVNLIGPIDVYHVNVHGQRKGMTPVLLDALRPRVAIMANGAYKGGDKASWPILRNSPGLEDIWQTHYSLSGGSENNPPANFIANLKPDCEHLPVTLIARKDGSFSISADTGTKQYPARGKR